MSRRQHLWWVVLAALIVTALYLVTPSPTPTPTCATEDEVLVRVEADAFHLEAGQLVCVHIDHLEVP